jgi:hypothetical protein
MTKLAVLFGLLWPVGALACGTTGMPLVSVDKGAPRVEVFLDGMKLAQPFSVGIEVCDDVAVEGVSIDAIMPAHQHGMNYTPTIVDLGEGAFRVDDMLFHMPGEWEIQLELIYGFGVTRYTQTTTLK